MAGVWLSLCHSYVDIGEGVFGLGCHSDPTSLQGVCTSQEGGFRQICSQLGLPAGSLPCVAQLALGATHSTNTGALSSVDISWGCSRGKVTAARGPGDTAPQMFSQVSNTARVLWLLSGFCVMKENVSG